MINKKITTEFEEKIYNLLKKVPKGKVTTYGYLAKATGRPLASRAVGNALNKNPYAPEVPCHRVITWNGRVGEFADGTDKKIMMLKREGVVVENGRVIEFEKIKWDF